LTKIKHSIKLFTNKTSLKRKLKGLPKTLPTVIVTWSAGEGVEQGAESGKLEEEGIDHRMNNTASGKKNFRYLKLKRQF